MSRIWFVAEGDEAGGIWLDAAAPIRLQRESAPPHRLAITGHLVGDVEAKGEFHVRLTRPDAYRLIDQLKLALEEDTSAGAASVIKQTKFSTALNGGVDRESGEMILVLRGQSGMDHHLVLPYDQSGVLLEVVERAAKAAGEWAEEQFTADLKGVQKVNIQPREAESVMVAEDPQTQRSILIVRLDRAHQFSFFLDQKIVERLIRKPGPRAKPFEYPLDPWSFIADDIELFGREWCTLYEPPSDADIRRGSAAMRRLLVEDWLGKAWRHFGFEKQPSVAGPDVLALLDRHGLETWQVASLVAGGATLNGIQVCMLGHARVDNEETGISADAEEGFAVRQFYVARDARGEADENDLTPLTNRAWPLSNYLDAPGAVRRGQVISRRDIVAYFANMGGGVHLGPAKPSKEQTYALVDELLNKVGADTMDGVFFELLSVGQAIGRSDDLKKLVARIRENSASQA